MDERAEGILKFWLEEVGPDGWYAPPEGLDDKIRERYADLWQEAMAGAHAGWTCGPRGSLARIILLDQFPRNMFRDAARAFASDAKALATAKSAIGRGHDQRIEMPARQFFYLPLEHSENIADQAQSVRRVMMSFGPGETLNHARAHRAVIRRFGRFPYRNAVLGRKSTPEELAFLDAGGYRAAFAEVTAPAAP